MDSPLPLKPASTVLTLRDGDQGVEVLMLRRNLRSDFVGGAYVFPGGGVDPGDLDVARRFASGLDDERAARRLGVHDALAYYAAALRELFEEAGLLLARDSNDRMLELSRDADVARFSEYRRRLNAKETSFSEILERENLRLDFGGLEYLAHWVTPEGPPRRFDTRFFVALAPGEQLAAHDAGETVADCWIRPVDALAAHERGDFEMIFPTIRTLESLCRFSTRAQVVAHAASLSAIARIQPRIVQRDGAVVILAPGDPGYDD